MKRKKIIIIIISIILVLAIAGGSLAYLYMTTDFMKDNKVLFAKYINQDVQIFENITQSSVPSAYREFYKTNNYESETNIKVGYSEGGEVSSPFNSLSMKINSQRDNDNNYFYCDAQLLYANEEYFEIEALKNQKTYGIRFSDVLRQFFSITDDDAINTVSADLGIEKSSIYSFFDILDGKEPTGDKEISETKINTLKDKYSKLIVQTVSEMGKYNKLKNSIITINNTSTKTNAYMVSLTGEQVKQVLVKILTEVRNDGVIDEIMDNKALYGVENKVDNSASNVQDTNQDTNNELDATQGETNNITTNTKTFKEKIDELIEKIQENENIGELKITVYEKNGTTVRTSIENGTNRIIIDNSITNEETKVILQRTKLNTEQTNQQTVKISKKQSNNEETFDAEIELVDGENSDTIKLENEMKQDSNGINDNMRITYSKNITEIMVSLENKTNVATQPIEKKEISEQDNFVLNKLNDESRKKIIEILKERINAKIEERTIALKTKLGLIIETPTEPEQPVDESQMTQVDINRFNSKFEFYTGESVTAENVKTLLKNVETNLKSIEFPLAQPTEGEGLSNNQAQSIKLNIEKDTSNPELIKQVEAKIEENSNYKVEISYKSSNGMIDYITITESK